MRTHPQIRGITLFVAFAALLFAGSIAGAADYYAGKTITIVCPYSTGGHLRPHVAAGGEVSCPGTYRATRPPSCTTVPAPAASSGLRSVYKAKPDGLSLIHFTSPMVVRSLTGGIEDIDFKKLTWLGSVGGAHYIFALRANRPERTIKDFQTTKMPIRVGASGPSSLLTQAPKFLQRAGKFNIRLVPGYKGYNPMALAMKQDEVDAVSTARIRGHGQYRDPGDAQGRHHQAGVVHGGRPASGPPQGGGRHASEVRRRHRRPQGPVTPGWRSRGS